MKSNGTHCIVGVLGALIAIMVTACQTNTQWEDFSCYQVQKTERMSETSPVQDEEGKEQEEDAFAQLHEDEPKDMVVTVDIQFLKTDNEATAKVCRIINEQLKELLLHQSGDLTDEEAVSQYIEDVKAEFRANETWEMYSEELTGRVEYGVDNILNYRILENSFAGGAHPSAVTTIFRFNASTGEFITLDNVFPFHQQKELKDLLLKRLMQKQKVNSLEELNAKGYLEWMDMFISNNFALRADSIEFYYNEYDIAPYAAGASTICLSYEETQELMDKEFRKKIRK